MKNSVAQKRWAAITIVAMAMALNCQVIYVLKLTSTPSTGWKQWGLLFAIAQSVALVAVVVYAIRWGRK